MRTFKEFRLERHLQSIDTRRHILAKGLFRYDSEEKVQTLAKESPLEYKIVVARAEELYKLLVDRGNTLLQLGREQEYKQCVNAIAMTNGHIFNLKSWGQA